MIYKYILILYSQTIQVMSLRVNVRGKNISFEVSLDSLVSTFKEKISERIGLPLEQIILLFNG